MRKILGILAMTIAAYGFGIVTPGFAQTVPVQGQVTKIDEATGRLTLKHEPIKNLDMDSMTMIFRVKDPAMLKSVKVGDAVTFEADRVNGAITIVKIETNK